MKKVLSIVAALVLSVTGISVARAGYIGDAYFPGGNGGILEQNDYQNNNNNVNPGGITDIVETEGDVAVDFNWIALIKEFDNLDRLIFILMCIIPKEPQSIYFLRALPILRVPHGQIIILSLGS